MKKSKVVAPRAHQFRNKTRKISRRRNSVTINPLLPRGMMILQSKQRKW